MEAKKVVEVANASERVATADEARQTSPMLPAYMDAVNVADTEQAKATALHR